MSEFNRRLIEEFRATGGRVGGTYAGTPLLLLTTTGRRSGRAHTTPLMYLEDAGRLVVFGTKAGAPSHPDWYLNLVASPEATVELGAERFAVRATTAGGVERDRLAGIQARERPQFAEYAAMTQRTIPVVLLERVGLGSTTFPQT